MKLLLARASPRCNIPEVEEQALPCETLRVCFYQEYFAYQEIKKFFLNSDYTHLVLATDDIVVKPEHIKQLEADLEDFNVPVIGGMMNVDQKDYPDGNLAITLQTPDYLAFYYWWLNPETLPKEDIFKVIFNGFCLLAIRRDIVEKYDFYSCTLMNVVMGLLLVVHLTLLSLGGVKRKESRFILTSAYL